MPSCRDDPTIMAWSLANEPRCQGDYSGAMLQARGVGFRGAVLHIAHPSTAGNRLAPAGWHFSKPSSS